MFPDSIQTMDVEVEPPPLENGTKTEENLASPPINKIEESPSQPTKPVTRQKRKRSQTPTTITDGEEQQSKINLGRIEENAAENGEKTAEEVKKPEENGETENGMKEDDAPITKRTRQQKELKETSQKASPKKTDSAKKTSPSTKNEVEESVDMEPLVISDEHEPELQFDEFSDKESANGSPIVTRCVTRRSLTRNIPTPKTPKSLEQDVEQEPEPTTTTTDQIELEMLPKTEIEHTESIDSTKVEVGSDETRLEYVETNATIPIDDSYLKEYRDKSLRDTIRCLSARKPIRDVYRNRSLRVHDRSNLDGPFQNSSGVKRKNRSITPEDSKKFKSDNASFFTSPLASLREKFRADTINSSTPLLRGYRDSRTELHLDESRGHAVESGLDDKKSWCSIM